MIPRQTVSISSMLGVMRKLGVLWKYSDHSLILWQRWQFCEKILGTIRTITIKGVDMNGEGEIQMHCVEVKLKL